MSLSNNRFATAKQSLLFGAINVEPKSAEYYRSQVTRADLLLTTKQQPSPTLPDGHPNINYNACYPNGVDCSLLGPNAKPILKMFNGNKELVHSDLTASSDSSKTSARLRSLLHSSLALRRI